MGAAGRADPAEGEPLESDPPAGDSSSGASARKDANEPGTVATSLGAFIRAQRQLANLSLRRMAELTEISNPYLSQLERGLHEPSVRVLRSIAGALQMPAEQLLERMGVAVSDDAEPVSTEAAIRADAALSDEQKAALLAVYRSYVAANQAHAPDAQRSAAPGAPAGTAAGPSKVPPPPRTATGRASSSLSRSAAVRRTPPAPRSSPARRSARS